MKTETEKNEAKTVRITLAKEQYEKVHQDFAQTTCRSLNAYLVKAILEGPVTILYRNQSLDDFMGEIMELRKQLEQANENMERAVGHTMGSSLGFGAMNGWMFFRMEKQFLIEKVNLIEEQIQKIAAQWLS